MHRESVSIIVQKDATIYIFIIFLQTALHVSSDTLTHHQEHMQTVFTASGTGLTALATFRCRKVASTVRPAPDAVTRVYMCSWWWVRISLETCRAMCRNIIKLYIVASCWTITDIVRWVVRLTRMYTVVLLSSARFDLQTSRTLTMKPFRCVATSGLYSPTYAQPSAIKQIRQALKIGLPSLRTLTFRRWIKSRLPFAGIIRSSPYSTGFQDKG